ncbi:MAG: PAS domain S-box protein [Candidatus Omnitrophota bacterium]
MGNRINVLIVGGGKGGEALIKMFKNSRKINITAVIDKNPEAPGVKFAREIGIPVLTDWEEILRKGDISDIFDVTGSPEVYRKIFSVKPAGVNLIGGVESKFMWHMVEEHAQHEKQLEEFSFNLRQRVRELDSLYSFAKLVESAEVSIDGIFRGVPGLLRKAAEYPERTCVRVIYRGEEYKTDNFKTTSLKREKEIIIDGKEEGSIEIYYPEDVSRNIENNRSSNGTDLLEEFAGRIGKVIHRMITDKKLEESEARYRALFESSLDAIILLDKDSKVISANPAAIEMFGYPDMKDFMGGYLPEFFSGLPEENPAKEKYREMKEEAGKNGSSFFECRFRTSWGKEFFATVLLRCFLLDGNEVILATVRDVSTRKMAEEKIKQARDFAELVFEVTPSATFTVNLARNVTSWNKRAEEITGYARDEIIGRPCTVFAEDPCTQSCGLYSPDVLKPLINKECTIKRKDGKKIFISKNVDLLKSGDGKVLGGIESFDDITERKETEKVMLENIRIKSNFTSMVSHELRTPLTAIKEGISIVWDGSAGEVNGEQKEFLEMAKNNVDRLARLINDVLDFSKLQSGKMVISKNRCNINELVSETLEIFMPMAREKGINIATSLKDNMPEINADADRIVQVITNLVNNAFKFTTQGAIEISTEFIDGEALVRIKDSGPGIKVEDKDKLFRAFVQLEDAKRRKTGGTGLGLAISKEIVESHGGRIWVESEYGKGSTFNFSLPFKKEYTVLVIDDDQAFLDLAEKILRNERYTVLTASKGKDGIEMAVNYTPDLIILDMKMPDINGYEVIGRLKGDKKCERIPVLAVSGYRETFSKLDDILKAADRDTIPRLVKPFDVEEFLSVVRSLTGKTG